MKLPHQVLGAAFGRVRAPGARTAAPKVKNCRTGATMLHVKQKRSELLCTVLVTVEPWYTLQ